MLFDTHSHIYFDGLKERIPEVLENMSQANVTCSVQIGCNLASSLESVNLSKQYDGIFASVGFHPVDIQDEPLKNLPSLIAELENIIVQNRENVVAIGETGLDFYHFNPEKKESQIKTQHAFFEAQSLLAQKYNLPLVIHSRECNTEIIAAIRKYSIKKAIIHCFSQNVAFAEELMSFSDEIYFSFSGIVTYKSAVSIQEAVQFIPLDRLLIETDAPFLAPVPLRGEINEPSYVVHVLKKLQSLRREDPEVIENTIFENSKRIFGI